MPAKFSAITRPLKEKIRNTDHSELKSSGFWVGHILMVIATIAGVYLAAQAGLKQAVLFDTITSNQASYHIRTSLADELADNIRLLRAYNTQYFSKHLSAQELKLNNPKLSHYVWDSMKYSSATLEIPSQFLNEVQRFYRNVNDIIEKSEQRIYAVSYSEKLLLEQLDHLETNVIPELRSSAAELQRWLAQHDVQVGQDGASQ